MKTLLTLITIGTLVSCSLISKKDNISINTSRSIIGDWVSVKSEMEDDDLGILLKEFGLENTEENRAKSRLDFNKNLGMIFSFNEQNRFKVYADSINFCNDKIITENEFEIIENKISIKNHYRPFFFKEDTLCMQDVKKGIVLNTYHVRVEKDICK